MQIIQIMRRARGPITAARIAEELEVTVRTVYRDVVSLQANGVPLRGEAGIGYVMGEGFDLPPLMFNVDELEALMLGARLVERQGDRALAAAARDAITKIATVIPKELKPVLLDAHLVAPDFSGSLPEVFDAADLRHALRDNRKLKITYVDEKDAETRRTVWPVALGYLEGKRLLIAWCELREDFRHFRTDRVRELSILSDRPPRRRAELFKEWSMIDAAEKEAYSRTR